MEMNDAKEGNGKGGREAASLNEDGHVRSFWKDARAPDSGTVVKVDSRQQMALNLA